MIWGRRCPIHGERAKLLDRAAVAAHFDCCVLCVQVDRVRLLCAMICASQRPLLSTSVTQAQALSVGIIVGICLWMHPLFLGPGCSLKHPHGTVYCFVCFTPNRRAGLALLSFQLSLLLMERYRGSPSPPPSHPSSFSCPSLCPGIAFSPLCHFTVETPPQVLQALCSLFVVHVSNLLFHQNASSHQVI